MPTPVTIFPDALELGRLLGTEIAEGILEARRDGRVYVLGCPGGRTPTTTLTGLAAEVSRRELELDHVIIAMMDDYVVRLNGGFEHVDADAHYSCRRFGREEIVAMLNAVAPKSRIAPQNLWLPDASDPSAYDDRLRGAGGVDLFVIASGATDGHVAFNPPGTSRHTTTRIVPLASTTKEDNLATFPNFGSVADVPNHGVTVGVGTIVELSHRLALILIGEHKRGAFQRIVAAGGYDPRWPATAVLASQNGTIYADSAAATDLATA